MRDLKEFKMNLILLGFTQIPDKSLAYSEFVLDLLNLKIEILEAIVVIRIKHSNIATDRYESYDEAWPKILTIIHDS